MRQDWTEAHHDVKIILVALEVQFGNAICVTKICVDLPLIWSSIGRAAFACLVFKLQSNLQAHFLNTFRILRLLTVNTFFRQKVLTVKPAILPTLNLNLGDHHCKWRLHFFHEIHRCTCHCWQAMRLTAFVIGLECLQASVLLSAIFLTSEATNIDSQWTAQHCQNTHLCWLMVFLRSACPPAFVDLSEATFAQSFLHIVGWGESNLHFARHRQHLVIIILSRCCCWLHGSCLGRLQLSNCLLPGPEDSQCQYRD